MKIKVYAPIHLRPHAWSTVNALIELGHEAALVYNFDPSSDDLHILYCAFNIKQFPKHYIIYQCEQWDSHWLKDLTLPLMPNAKQVWEWSENNMQNYAPVVKSKCFHVPPGLIDAPVKVAKDIDVLFYGTVDTHREKILNEVKKYFQIKIVDNVFGGEMLTILSRAKVVLNIPYYIPGILEAFRINESLCYGAQVVSERNSKNYNPIKYKELVHYWSNIGELIFVIKKALALGEMKKDLSVLDNREYIKAAIEKL